MRKLKTSLRTIARGAREIHRLSPYIILFSIINSLATAVTPFVNIYFSSEILEVLSTTQDTALLVRHVAFALGANFALYLLGRTTGQLTGVRYNRLYFGEQNTVSRKMLNIDYETLGSTTFQETVTRHKSQREQSGSPFTTLVWVFSSWISGLTIIGISIAFLLPIMRLIFVRTGNSFIESPWFAIAVLAATLVGVTIVLLMSSKSNKRWFALNKEYLEINRTFQYYNEMLTNYKTGKEIRIFREADLIEKHATAQMIDKGVQIQHKIARVQSRSSAFMAMIGAILGCGIYLLIGLKGLAGLFGIGSLVRYMGSFLQIVQGLMNLGMSTGRLSSILPGLQIYFDVIDTVGVQTQATKPLQLSKSESVITFKHVSFRYPGTAHYALKDVSFTLRPGERFAVVGENGSGKTTFIKLLCRMYDVQEGEILLNGVNIQEYDAESYRRLFSVVFQDFHVFSMPLGNTIASQAEYDAEKVMRCLTEGGFEDRIQHMPKGLDTYLYKDCDDNGVEISGGEAQKLALARALYKDAPFIILDEPTAALDPIAEFQMYSQFNDFVGDKGAIYISHRLSSCRFCSKIAVFERGRITQLGAHEELIQDAQGKYYELWYAQAQYYVQ